MVLANDALSVVIIVAVVYPCLCTEQATSNDTAQPEDFPHLSSDRTFQLKGGTSSLESHSETVTTSLVRGHVK